MFKCTHCGKTYSDQDQRAYIAHMFSQHNISPSHAQVQAQAGMNQGYYEPHSDEVPAPEHQAAAIRTNLQNQHIMTQRMKIADPVSVPIVQIEQKKMLSLPDGWVKSGDSYLFEQVLSEVHDIDNITKRIIKGNVTANHGSLQLFSYSKNTEELFKLQQKERILSSRLDSFVPSDSSFLSIVQQLNPLHSRIKSMKSSLRNDVESETVLEDYFRGTQGRDGQITWQEDFMKKCLEETNRVKGIVSKKDEIPIGNHKAED